MNAGVAPLLAPTSDQTIYLQNSGVDGVIRVPLNVSDVDTDIESLNIEVVVNDTDVADASIVYQYHQIGQDLWGDSAGQYFGRKVQISADGNRLAVLANGNINEFDGDDQIISQSPANYIRTFSWDGEVWQKLGADIDLLSNPDFARSTGMALSDDGQTLIYSKAVSGADRASTLEVSDWNGSLWERRSTILGDLYIYDANPEDGVPAVQYREGLSSEDIVLSGDGSTVLTYVHREDDRDNNIERIRAYRWNGNHWEKTGNDLTGLPGYWNTHTIPCDINEDGSIIACNSYNSYTYTIYELFDEQWQQKGSVIERPDLPSSTNSDVIDRPELSSDGLSVLMGSYGNKNQFIPIVLVWGGQDWIQETVPVSGYAFGNTTGVIPSTHADVITQSLSSNGGTASTYDSTASMMHLSKVFAGKRYQVEGIFDTLEWANGGRGRYIPTASDLDDMGRRVILAYDQAPLNDFDSERPIDNAYGKVKVYGDAQPILHVGNPNYIACEDQTTQVTVRVSDGESTVEEAFNLTIKPYDGDQDGLPDCYEARHGLSSVENDAALDLDNDGLTNLEEYLLGTNVAIGDTDGDGQLDGYDHNPLNSQYQGSDFVKAQVNQNWKAVNFNSQFDMPIVIAAPPSFNGSDPGVVRIRNVNKNGFEAKFQLRFQEWDYRLAAGDNIHAEEEIPHVILEEGRHVMSDGSIWEVGRFDLSGTGQFKAVNFSSAFNQKPKLFLTIQTTNGGQAVTVRAKDVTETGFKAALFEEQRLMDGHVLEDVGYLAIYQPAGSGYINLGGEIKPYLLQTSQIDHQWRPVFSTALKVEEERSSDLEIAHIPEWIDLLSLGGDVYAQDISTLGGDTSALRQKLQSHSELLEWGVVDGITSDWTVVPLNKSYSNPVVVASLGQRNGSDLGVVQVRNVTPDSFEVRFAEWDYLDKVHSSKERINYIVAESGGFTIGNGEINVLAGISSINNQVPDASLIEHYGYFDNDYVLLTGVMSANGSQTAVPRVMSSDSIGFQMGLQEQQSLNDGHTYEDVGWIAIKTGETTLGQRRISAINIRSTHDSTTKNFGFTFDAAFPVGVQSLSTTNGIDPAIAEQSGLTSSSISLKVQEEASADVELSHVEETIGVFIAN